MRLVVLENGRERSGEGSGTLAFWARPIAAKPDINKSSLSGAL